MEHSFHMTAGLAASRIDSVLHLTSDCSVGQKAKIHVSWGERWDESGATNAFDTKI